MKKLILLIAIALIAVSTGLSLEPTRVSVYAPEFRTVAEGGSGPATSVRVDLVDYNGGATTLYTGKVFSAPDAEVTADDNGVILVTVGGSTDVHPTLGPSTFADVWGDIDAGNMNTFWTFDIYINGDLYSQGRIDQQVIIQANTSIFNSSGVLLPSGNPSTVGDDNNRFDAVYVKENEADADLEGVYIGPSGGVGTNQLSLTYDNTAGEGIITANGTAIMDIDANGIDFNGKILDNVAEINDGNQALEISGAFTANQDLNVIGATPGTDARKLTINGVPRTTPFTPPFPEAFELSVDGDVEVTGYLEVIGLSLLGDFNMNDNDIYNINELRGRSDTDVLLLNSTNNGAITSGTGQVTLGGNLDANGGVDVTGDDLTVNDGTNDIFVVDVSAGDIFLGASAAEGIYMNGEVQTNIVPGSGSLTLGTDADRWLGAYFLGNSVHVGDANGDNSAELEIGWASDVATFAVNGTTPQFAIDATPASEMLTMDPAGDGTANYTFEEGGLTVSNPGLFGDIVVTDGGILTANGQNFSFLATTGNIDVVVDGRIDVQSAASTIGDGADATQLTVEGLVAGAADALVVEGSTDIDARLNVDGNTTLNANVDLGDANTDAISFLGRVDTNVEPIANNAHALGSDALRWSALWVDGNAVHIGEANGDNSAELELSYLNDVGSINVDGATNSQITVDANTDVVAVNASDDGNNEVEISASGVVIDANSDATDNYTLTSTEATINTGANTDLVITEGTIERNNTATETLVFQNTDGANVLDVDIEGKIDVQSAASTIGDGTDAAQLTVEGVVSDDATLVYDFALQGDADIDGALNVGGISILGTTSSDSVMINGDIGSHMLPTYDNQWSIGSSSGDKWRNLWLANNANVGNDLQVDDDANIDGDLVVALTSNLQGNVDADSDLNVDGNTTLNGNVDLGDGVTDLITPVGRFDDTMEPNVTNAYDLGLNTFRWRNLWLGNNAAVGGNLEVVGTSNLQGNVDADSDLNVDGVITNTTAATAVTVDDDLNVTGSADIDTDLNVDGNTVHVGTLDQQGIVSSSTGDLLFEDNLIPNTDATHDLGSSSNQWVDLHLSNNAEVGNNVNAGNNVNVSNNLRLLEDPGNGTNVVGFTAPANLASNTIWTLPDDDGTANQQLITDGSGNLSWGDASLQTAYEGGNTITTDGTNGDIIIDGTQVFDLQIPLVNTSGSNAVEIDDALDISGNIALNAGSGDVFTVNTAGNTVIEGNLDVNSGLDVTGANFTVGDGILTDRFRVTQSGNTLIEGTLTVNAGVDMTAGLDVTGANFTVGSDFTVNNSNGNTNIGGTLSQSQFTGAVSGTTQENVIITTGNVALGTLTGYATGSVVHIASSTTATFNLTGGANQNPATATVRGATVVFNGSSWFVVSTY